MDSIEMPIDPHSVIHTFVPEEVEPVLTNLFRLVHGFLYHLGEPLAQAP